MRRLLVLVVPAALGLAGCDSQAPRWPADATLTATATDGDRLAFEWPEARDDTGVESYLVWVDGERVARLGPDARSWATDGLESDTEPVVEVVARDAAGNQSSTLHAGPTTSASAP
ncbi:MAG TPA: hypothetical protein RMH99_25010 [Sandaracinaceae bacterium LLY-WYZ-13_1]|nr:hypothetical protein [Sandaracinaceae bacterium LLY-WYZ-13_1]